MALMTIMRGRNLHHFIHEVEGLDECDSLFEFFNRADDLCDRCGDSIEDGDELAWMWGESRFKLFMHGECFDKWMSGLMEDHYRLKRNITNKEARRDRHS